MFLDRASWELSAAVRFRLLSSPDGGAPLYVGGGPALIDWGPLVSSSDLLLVGFEAPLRTNRPYLEVQVLDPFARLATAGGDFGVQVHIGVNHVVRRRGVSEEIGP